MIDITSKLELRSYKELGEQIREAAALFGPSQEAEPVEFLKIIDAKVDRPKMEADKMTLDEHATDSRSCQVLLVEDNLVNQEVAKEMLKSFGCNVVCAQNGRHALEAIAGKTFDVVFMDCQMPELDGYETTRRLRKYEESATNVAHKSRLPVIALTAHAVSGDRDQCIEAGMDDYLTKPVTLGRLGEVLLRWGGKGPKSEPFEEACTIETPGDRSSHQLQGRGLIEVKALDNIRFLAKDGSGSLLTSVIDLFNENAKKTVTSIKQAIDAKDSDGLRSAAHSLKSASAYVGAVQLSSFCRDLERLGRHGELKNAQDIYSDLEREALAVRRTLEDELEREDVA